MVEMAADGIDYDTVASTGDAEFLASCRRREHIAKITDMAVEIGMSAEIVLGFHGELEYEGTRLAGLWPHQQLEALEKAGAAIFGPVVNTNSKSRRLERVACRDLRQGLHRGSPRSPMHANVGKGVGGVPMFETPAGRHRHALQCRHGRDRRSATGYRWVQAIHRHAHGAFVGLVDRWHQDCWRSGSPYATAEDEEHRSQEVRGRQASRHAARPVRPDSSCAPA